MPIILRNKTATIEIDINVNLQHIIVKGSFDVTMLNTGIGGVPIVWILFRRSGQIQDNIGLDWRDISSPTVTSATDLLDLILSWNIPPTIITSSALPNGAATSAKQLPDKHGVKIVDLEGVSRGLLVVDDTLVTSPYYYAISDEKVTGHVAWDRLALNTDIDIGSEDIWSVGGTYVFPAVAQQMEIVSTSVEDDPDKGGAVAGSGIHTVTLYYLTNDFTEKTEDINLNGTGSVTTVGTDIYRVQALKAKVCGTGGAAAGAISIRNLADTPIYSQIEAGLTRSRNSIYTVPKGKKLFICCIFVGVASASITGATVTLKAKYDHDANAARDFFLPHAEVATGSGASREFSIPIIFPAGVDIKCSATTLANNTTVNVGMRGWLETV